MHIKSNNTLKQEYIMTSVVNCIIDKTFTAPTFWALLQEDYMPVH